MTSLKKSKMIRKKYKLEITKELYQTINNLIYLHAIFWNIYWNLIEIKIAIVYNLRIWYMRYVKRKKTLAVFFSNKT